MMLSYSLSRFLEVDFRHVGETFILVKEHIMALSALNHKEHVLFMIIHLQVFMFMY